MGCYYLPEQDCGSCNLVFAEIKKHKSQYPHTALRAVQVVVPEHYVLAHHVRACTQHGTVSFAGLPGECALLWMCSFSSFSIFLS